jgi:perosamine synthetase
VPVFADIEEQSWCISAKSLEECITPRTKAVIPVDLYGNMPDMDAIRQIAAHHHIAIIEDAAEAIGSEYQNGRAGSFGDTGVFSFHGSKTLTTGEGGMLVTNRQDIFERVLFLRDHGRKPRDSTFCSTEVAYKYKMSGLQAALGLAQLERIEDLIRRKREIFDWYRQELAGLQTITLNSERPGTSNTYWMVTVIVDPRSCRDKSALIDAMGRANIDCRPFFHPLSSLPAYAGLPQGAAAQRRNTVAYQISPYGINLPSGLNLTRSDVEYVCGALRHCLGAIC